MSGPPPPVYPEAERDAQAPNIYPEIPPPGHLKQLDLPPPMRRYPAAKVEKAPVLPSLGNVGDLHEFGEAKRKRLMGRLGAKAWDQARQAEYTYDNLAGEHLTEEEEQGRVPAGETLARLGFSKDEIKAYGDYKKAIVDDYDLMDPVIQDPTWAESLANIYAEGVTTAIQVGALDLIQGIGSLADAEWAEGPRWDINEWIASGLESAGVVGEEEMLAARESQLERVEQEAFGRIGLGVAEIGGEVIGRGIVPVYGLSRLLPTAIVFRGGVEAAGAVGRGVATGLGKLPLGSRFGEISAHVAAQTRLGKAAQVAGGIEARSGSYGATGFLVHSHDENGKPLSIAERGANAFNEWAWFHAYEVFVLAGTKIVQKGLEGGGFSIAKLKQYGVDRGILPKANEAEKSYLRRVSKSYVTNGQPLDFVTPSLARQMISETAGMVAETAGFSALDGQAWGMLAESIADGDLAKGQAAMERFAATGLFVGMMKAGSFRPIKRGQRQERSQSTQGTELQNAPAPTGEPPVMDRLLNAGWKLEPEGNFTVDGDSARSFEVRAETQTTSEPGRELGQTQTTRTPYVRVSKDLAETIETPYQTHGPKLAGELAKMSKTSLVEWAANKGIEIRGKITKKQLIEGLVRSHFQEFPEADGSRVYSGELAEEVLRRIEQATLKSHAQAKKTLPGVELTTDAQTYEPMHSAPPKIYRQRSGKTEVKDGLFGEYRPATVNEIRKPDPNIPPEQIEAGNRLRGAARMLAPVIGKPHADLLKALAEIPAVRSTEMDPAVHNMMEAMPVLNQALMDGTRSFQETWDPVPLQQAIMDYATIATGVRGLEDGVLGMMDAVQPTEQPNATREEAEQGAGAVPGEPQPGYRQLGDEGQPPAAERPPSAARPGAGQPDRPDGEGAQARAGEREPLQQRLSPRERREQLASMPDRQLAELAVAAGIPATSLQEVPRQNLESILHTMGLPTAEALAPQEAGPAEATIPEVSVPGGAVAGMRGIGLDTVAFLQDYPGKPRGRGTTHEMRDVPVSVARDLAENLPPGRARTRIREAVDEAEGMGPEAGMLDPFALIHLVPGLTAKAIGKLTSAGPVAWYAKPVIEEAMDFTSAHGKAVAQAALDVVAGSKRIAGRVERRLRKIQKMTSGLRGSSHRKETKSLSEGIWDGDFGEPKLLAIIEGRWKGEITPKEQEIVDELEALRKDIGTIAEEIGIMRTDADGEVSRFKTPKGPLMVRQYTEAMHDLVEGSDLYNKIAEGIGKYNDMGEGQAKGLLSSHIREGWTRPDATEVKRTIKRLPAMVKQGTIVTHVLEASPFRYATTLVRRASLRLGFVQVFGQDINLRHLEGGEEAPVAGKTGKILQELKKTEGAKGARVGIDIFRLLHGLPITPPRAAKPGTLTNELYRYMIHLPGGLWRAGKLSKAFIINLPEAAAAGGTYLGMARITKAYWTVAANIASNGARGRKSEILQKGEELGVLQYTPLHADWQRGRKIEDAVRVLGGIITTPLRGVQFYQEAVAYTAATQFAHDLAMGKGRPIDEASLVQFGYGEERVAEYMGGIAAMRKNGLSKDEMARRWGDLIGRAVSYTIPGKSQAPVEKSRAAHDRFFNELIAFNGYFQARGGQLRRLLETYGESLSAGDVARANTNALLVTKFVGITTGVGVAGILLGYLVAGTLWETLHEMQEEGLVNTAGRGFFANMFSAHGAILRDAAASGDAGEVFDGFLRSIPAKSAWEVVKDFGFGTGPYEGKGIAEDPLAGIAQLLREMPAVGLIENGLFGLSFWQITNQDQGFRSARRAFYRWYELNDPREKVEKGTRESTRLMRVAWNQLKFNQDPDDPKFLRYLGLAMEVKRGEAKYEGVRERRVTKQVRQDLAASIRSRRLRQGSEWTKLTGEQKEDLEQYVGPEGWQKLVDMDELLDSVAQRIRRGRLDDAATEAAK